MGIPTSWKDITIGQFIEGWEILHTEFSDELDKQIAFTSAVTGYTEQELRQMRHKELLQVISDLKFLENPDAMSKKFPKIFSIKGRMFKPCRRFDKLSFGQFTDLTSFVKKPDEIMGNMHKILATLCIPFRYNVKIQTVPNLKVRWFYWYDGSKHEEISDFLYENMTMDIAYPIVVFFCNLWAALLPNILTYLEKEMKSLEKIMTPDQIQSLKAAFSNPSDGFTPSMDSLGKTYSNGIR